jgi:hypothetical protein
VFLPFSLSPGTWSAVYTSVRTQGGWTAVMNMHRGADCMRSAILLLVPLWPATHRVPIFVITTGRSQWPRDVRHELSSLERCDRGFESHSRHGCLCAFILCLCCYVCRKRPCDGLIPHLRIPNDCVWVKKLKKRRRFNKGL